ncbi:aspartyl protease family protein [Arachidicoccus sp.]|uniref:aspartyl protease family protein n=1 Tax=Arachidicoccus sp. TaxID=1872624 RepID=UPI003D1A0EEB
MRVLLFLLYSLFAFPLFAQRRSTHHNIANQASYITSFPFKLLSGGIILVKGKIDNYPDTLNFVMDTGCSSASLDSTTCVRLKIPFISSNSYIRGVGSFKKTVVTNIKTLEFPHLEFKYPEFHIDDYELLSEVYGVKIDGIIGYNFFKRFIVQFNFDSLKVFVFKPGEFVYEKPGEILYPFMGNRIPTISASVKNGVKVNDNYYFDMGAGLCLLFSNQFVKDSSIFRKTQRRRKTVATVAQGLGGEINMNLTTIQEIKVGSYSFRNVPTYTFDDVSNVTNYPVLGGIMGNDLLRRFNITLNYPAGKIYIHPNSHFKDLFDYSYTGLTLYFMDRRVNVGNVAKDSPSAKAGILPGDVIIAVNNNFSNNIQTYTELLKKAGTKATITLTRNGLLMKKTLYIKSIL